MLWVRSSAMFKVPCKKLRVLRVFILDNSDTGKGMDLTRGVQSSEDMTLKIGEGLHLHILFLFVDMCREPQSPLQDGTSFCCACRNFPVNKHCAHVQKSIDAKSQPIPGHVNGIMSKQPIRCGHAALRAAPVWGSGSSSSC